MKPEPSPGRTAGLAAQRPALTVALALLVGSCAPAPQQPTRQEPPPEPERTVPQEQAPEPEPTRPEAPEPQAPEPATTAPAESRQQPEKAGDSEESVPREPTPDEPPAAPSAGTEEPTAQAPPAPPEPATMSVSGRVSLTGGEAAPAQTVVYFVPEDRQQSTAAAPLPEPFEIVTADKELSPTVGVVTRGTTLRFPNRDPILHNLFSVSGDNRFDVGLYGPGEAPTTSVNAPGVVDIFCNVHHQMHAHVLVLDSPHYTRADSSGRFELTDLPRTPGHLHVWHRQTDGWSVAIQPPADNAISIDLEVTRPALPPHRDKRGQSYQRRDRDPYR